MNLRIVKTWFLELWSSIFRPENQSALSLFWKFLLGHFIFGYKDEFLSNWSDFWFQIILKVCLIGFLENIKNGAQNGAPPYFQTLNISIVYGKFFFKCWNVQNLKIWRGSILGSIFMFSKNPIRHTLNVIWNQKTRSIR